MSIYIHTRYKEVLIVSKYFYESGILTLLMGQGCELCVYDFTLNSEWTKNIIIKTNKDQLNR